MTLSNCDIKIHRRNSLLGVVSDLKELLDICYPHSPKDVFYRLVEQYKDGFPLYLAIDKSQKIVGFTYLAPNSKGGTLECLSVHPDFRGNHLGKKLVKSLLDDNIGVIQITTRIPSFFENLSFQRITQLPDQSYFMIYLNFRD
jgi:N-acetylglutamate synthase-like GNAT family acetyltransferase